jgi:hypothetical protein
MSDSARNFPDVCFSIAKEGPIKYYNSSNVRLQKEIVFLRFSYTQFMHTHVVSDCEADFNISSNLW